MPSGHDEGEGHADPLRVTLHRSKGKADNSEPNLVEPADVNRLPGVRQSMSANTADLRCGLNTMQDLDSACSASACQVGVGGGAPVGSGHMLDKEALVSFVRAVHLKYQDDDDQGQEMDNIVIMHTSGNIKTTASGTIKLPKHVSMSGQEISIAGNQTCIQKMCARVTELDLMENNISSWEEVFTIIECIPHLTFLNLTNNTLTSDLPPLTSLRSRPLPCLTHLVLNSTGVGWDTLGQLLLIFPSLTELHLSLNNYKHFGLASSSSPPPPPPSLSPLAQLPPPPAVEKLDKSSPAPTPVRSHNHPTRPENIPAPEEIALNPATTTDLSSDQINSSSNLSPTCARLELSSIPTEETSKPVPSNTSENTAPAAAADSTNKVSVEAADDQETVEATTKTTIAAATETAAVGKTTTATDLVAEEAAAASQSSSAITKMSQAASNNTCKETMVDNSKTRTESSPSPPTTYPSLRRLFFTGNLITDWAEMSKLGRFFPNLEYLLLSETKLFSLGDPEVIPHCFPKLKSLGLGKTCLVSWEEVEKLSLFPCLTDVRLSGVPFLDSFPVALRFLHTVALLPNIRTLNGSSIGQVEREDAERAFLRTYMDAEVKPERYYALERQHGRLDPLVQVELKPRRTVRLSVRVEDAQEQLVSQEEMDIEVDQTVRALRKLLSNMAERPASKISMFYLDKESPQGLERLIYMDRKLHSYNMLDGDEIIVAFKD